MPDTNFFERLTPMSVEEAVLLAGASLVAGDEAAMLNNVAAPEEDDLLNTVIYCSDAALIESLAGKSVGLCLATEALAERSKALLIEGSAVAAVSSPRLGFALIADRLFKSIEKTAPMARADWPKASEIDETARIDASASIAEGARIGPHVHIGPGVIIGGDCIIEAGVSITHARIGNRVHILSGARIGQAGFGFEQSPQGLVRVPQLGGVSIGDAVEIGANSTIDRGALADTVIGRGTKIDNQVQIGHNTRIGSYCVLAAQTGISGSCIIGDGVFMGGKVGLADHLTIGDGAQIAAGSGLMRDVPPGEKWGGAPARPIRDWLKETATLAKLARKKNG